MSLNGAFVRILIQDASPSKLLKDLNCIPYNK
jgi:hypothetical protein